jgi:cytidyltransferase-like protein
MLHSGHIAFFEEAARYGDLYVGIGSDQTIQELKARKTINTDVERLYMVNALKVVKEAWINSGSGILDFAEDVKRLQPDIFFVNSDGHSPAKELFCRQLEIQYIVSERIPHNELPARSTTALRKECLIPYRIDLAGGWLDQPFVNKYYPGSVITVSIEPDYEFNDRSGMSTSSRKKAIELWHTDIPNGDREMLARTLFCFENPPGTAYVSGSQDALGIVMPGLNRFFYDNDYWPKKMDKMTDPDLLSWIEQRIWLISLYPREHNYDVLANTHIDANGAMALSQASEDCWKAILNKDVNRWGRASVASFEAQLQMFPNMISKNVNDTLEAYKSQVLGWKLSGAGGGGYLVVVNETPVRNAIQIRIRRDGFEIKYI